MVTSLHRSAAFLNAQPRFSLWRDWTTESSLKWMETHWHWSIYASAIYVVTIFSLQRLMADRKPFNLRGALALWNVGLSIFSIIGSYYMVGNMRDLLLPSAGGSLWGSICISTSSHVAQYWLWLFILSKILELGDTMFIVLRKQKLILLHWYHHVVTLIFCWYSTSQNISLGSWFAMMNYLVHSIMYAYYAARAMRIRVPRGLAMLITSLQITQMVIGLFVVLYGLAAKYLTTSTPCETPLFTLQFAFSMYISFFVLFCSFFRSAYLPPAPSSSSSSSSKSKLTAVNGKSMTNGHSASGDAKHQNHSNGTLKHVANHHVENHQNHNSNHLINHHNNHNHAEPERGVNNHHPHRATNGSLANNNVHVPLKED